MRFLVAVSVLLAGCSLLPPDARLARCLAGPDSGNHVQAAFEMSRARDLWDHFPAAGKAPELETESPAFVVVMLAPVNIPTTGGPGPAEPRRNAVCVLVDGVPNVYSNVDLTGFHP